MPKNHAPFYKVGITNRSIDERFAGESIPFVVLYSESYLFGQMARDRETQILRDFKDDLSTALPALKSGNAECFCRDVLRKEKTGAGSPLQVAAPLLQPPISVSAKHSQHMREFLACGKYATVTNLRWDFLYSSDLFSAYQDFVRHNPVWERYEEQAYSTVIGFSRELAKVLGTKPKKSFGRKRRSTGYFGLRLAR
jgi:hypothetical protein